MDRIWIALGVLVIAIGLLIVTQNMSDTAPEDSELTIVTTFYPVTTLTEAVVGQTNNVHQLVASGQGVHTYRPKPRDVQILSNADVLIINGAGVEHKWLDTLIDSADRTDLPMLDLSEFVAAKFGLLDGSHNHGRAHEEKAHGESTTDDHDQETETHHQEHDEETETLETDPHIWLSPKNAIVMTEAIRDQLIEIDLSNTSAYTTNARAFIDQLEALDQEIEAVATGFDSTEFVAFHNAFSYFARDYGLQQVGVIELTPGESPTPGQIVEIKSLVADHNLSALFSEPQFSSSVVDQVARDLGIEVLVLDPLETNETGQSYTEAMRRNLQSLSQALE